MSSALGTALVAVLALAAWVVFRLRLVLAVGAGYKAKVLCTGIFASRRTMDPARDAQIAADSYWILRPFRVEVDSTRRSVTASFLGLWPRTAVHRDGLGATLLPAGDTGGESKESPALESSPREMPVWPSSRGSDAILRVVDDAFEEPNARRLRRTQAVLVAIDGRIVAERYSRGITADTPLPGWSMAKSVLNALVGVLVDDGRLALTRHELLPQWQAPDARAAITLEDLLRMRSGLRFSEAYGNPWSDVVQMLYNRGDTAGFAASRPLDARPGRVWQYASGTSNILSRIVRRTVGDEIYHAWPRRALFDRLGMATVVLEPDAAGTFVCSSYMLATARDWARYGQMWLDGGRWGGNAILSSDWVRFSATPTPQSPDGRYGAHWWLKLNPEIGGDSPDARAIPADALFAVGHEAQTLTVIPSRRLVVVRLGAAIYVDAWNQAAFIARLLEAL